MVVERHCAVKEGTHRINQIAAGSSLQTQLDDEKVYKRINGVAHELSELGIGCFRLLGEAVADPWQHLGVEELFLLCERLYFFSLLPFFGALRLGLEIGGFLSWGVSC